MPRASNSPWKTERSSWGCEGVYLAGAGAPLYPQTSQVTAPELKLDAVPSPRGPEVLKFNTRSYAPVICGGFGREYEKLSGAEALIRGIRGTTSAPRFDRPTPTSRLSALSAENRVVSRSST